MKYQIEGETRFALKPMAYSGEPAKCSDNLCPRVINSDKNKLSEECFIDLLTGGTLCDQCGKCLRYARKKAHQRGESIETAEV